jgi:Fe-Mn family superoxide dismutase
MTFQLPDLPYERDALAPHVSAETIEYHHGKHHAGYVRKLNEAVAGTRFADMSLEAIVHESDGKVFDNAAQHWNHSFYWNCLSPRGGGDPSGTLAEKIRDAFGDLGSCRKAFDEAASGVFGSGWAWLVRDQKGGLAIRQTANAENPLLRNETALLTCDMWEHAYYIDYRNAKKKYLAAFWQLVNWRFAADRLAG